MNPRLPVLILLLWLPFIGGAQLPASTRFDNLGIEAGLSQSTVYCILQDYLGYMWIGTEDGVNQYDGYRFRIFRNEAGNPKSIANSQVIAAHEDRYHNLWFITVNGISRFNRVTEDFDRVLFRPGLIRNGGPPLLLSRGEETFFTDAGILYRINGKTRRISQRLLHNGATRCHLLAIMPDSSLLVRDESSLYTYDPATDVYRQAALSAGLEPGFSPEGAQPLPGNRILLYGSRQLLICNAATGEKIKQLDLGVVGPGVKARSLFDDRGYFWLSSVNGAVCVDTGTMQYRVFFSHTADAGSLAGNIVRCFYKDRSGIVWIGTNEGGVSRLAPNKMKFSGMSTEHDGLPGLKAKAVLGFGEDPQGAIWMATDAASINIYDPRRQSIERCDKNSGCPFHTSSYILTILVDDSVAWCGHDDGVDVVSVRTHRIIATPLLLPGVNVKRIFRDAGGTVWAAGRNALYTYRAASRRFERYSLPSDLPDIDDIIRTKDGHIWIGITAGLIRYNPAIGKLVNYGARYPELIGSSTSLGAFCTDSAGVLYIGTSEHGLLRYEAATDSFTVWNTSSGLPNDVVYATVADNENRIWLTTNSGVSRFDPAAQRFSNFTVKDGLQSNEGIGRAIFKDHTGRLYFGNIAGFNSIVPEHINVNTVAPKPQITAFRVFDKEILFRTGLAKNGRIELEQSQNSFSIEYSAMDYTNPTENRFRIMLEGFDRDWRPLSAAHTVSYTNLDAGYYTFKVIAYNNDNMPSAQVLELPVYVRPPFYKTWWFLSLAFFLAVWIAFGIVWLRVRSIKQKAAASLQLSNLDRQMTEYKLQALQAQMNPHFIFNSLNAIQSIILQNDALKAAAYLADFSKLMRRILDNSHEQFVSLETIVETLKMYVHLEAFRFNHEFVYEFRVDEDLPMKELKLPPMLLQPYVENAILHGLMPKEGDKRLLIALSEKDNALHCIIEDNGIGRSAGGRKRGHVSRGEQLTRGIRESLNHLRNITATINYHDLKDAAGAASGTRVEIIIPLS